MQQALEAVVDIHTFDPTDLENMAKSAGADQVHAATEEFAAALLGWPVRTFEAACFHRRSSVGAGGVSLSVVGRHSAGSTRRCSATSFLADSSTNVMITGVKPGN